MFIQANNSLLWMTQIRTLSGLIFVGAGTAPVWLCPNHPQHPHDISSFKMIGLGTTSGYMIWFSAISHSYIITPLEDVHIPRPPKQEVRHDQQFRAHQRRIMGSGVVEQGSATYESLNAILKGFMKGTCIVVGMVWGSRGARATQ
ncbi:transmembrane protein, putative [Medicago truncatula]|uniref:Transmembrane protein, putative n=1 Tax=Medicago truncatula TaxID=3880 RepID=A0A072TPS9_MEDTR|nr:transmembrane protein, putative [Medicago truncatula]